MHIYRALCFCGLALSVSACSTLIDGTSQQIGINTVPAGANCILSRDGGSIGAVNPTPGSVVVTKTRGDISVACSKDGYQDSVSPNKSGVAAATFGNILIGGLIGVAVDEASGAANKYDTQMLVTMTPTPDPVAGVVSPIAPATPPAPPVAAVAPVATSVVADKNPGPVAVIAP